MKQCTHGRNGKCVLVCVSRRERESSCVGARVCVGKERFKVQLDKWGYSSANSLSRKKERMCVQKETRYRFLNLCLPRQQYLLRPGKFGSPSNISTGNRVPIARIFPPTGMSCRQLICSHQLSGVKSACFRLLKLFQVSRPILKTCTCLANV